MGFSLAILRVWGVDDFAAEDQVPGQTPGGPPRYEVGGPLAVHGEQRAHLQPAGDDGVQLVSAAAEFLTELLGQQCRTFLGLVADPPACRRVTPVVAAPHLVGVSR